MGEADGREEKGRLDNVGAILKNLRMLATFSSMQEVLDLIKAHLSRDART